MNFIGFRNIEDFKKLAKRN